MTTAYANREAEPRAAPLPARITAATANEPLTDWARANRDLIEERLRTHGAVLFRGFAVSGEHEFEAFAATVCRQLVRYEYRSTPRTQLSANVYTATEYAAAVAIPLHNENAYQRDWPMRLLFHCAQPAAQGGATPIADIARVTARIPRDLFERFKAKRIRYLRNYGAGVDLPWQTVFQTADKAAVERYCRAHDIDLQWRPKDCLRTWQVCDAVVVHPVHGRELWFNQAHLFHISSHDARSQRALRACFQEDELPRNAYFGDGSPLDPVELEQVRAAFAAESVSFPWQRGDVMLVDNMAVAHGRTPFSGARRVLVAMGDPRSTL